MYILKCSLSEYRKKVQENEWDFPAFHDYCPLCGGKECAVRIGYYTRMSINIESNSILVLYIARYLCKGKKKRRFKDKTFSLLPHHLIPYYAFTIDSYMMIINNQLVKKKRIKSRYWRNYANIVIMTVSIILKNDTYPAIQSFLCKLF